MSAQKLVGPGSAIARTRRPGTSDGAAVRAARLGTWFVRGPAVVADHHQRVAFLPRLLEGRAEVRRGLGAGESELPVDHEERDAADAQGAGFGEIAADVVGVLVGAEQFGDVVGVEAQIRAKPT